MSNQLYDRLELKTMMFPSWFGCSTEQWTSLTTEMDEFISQERTAEIVSRLLDIEDDPDYWMHSNAWPYPDVNFIKDLSLVIDRATPPDWPLEAKTFCLAWAIQSLRFTMMKVFVTLQHIRTKSN